MVQPEATQTQSRFGFEPTDLSTSGGGGIAKLGWDEWLTGFDT